MVRGISHHPQEMTAAYRELQERVATAMNEGCAEAK